MCIHNTDIYIRTHSYAYTHIYMQTHTYTHREMGETTIIRQWLSGLPLVQVRLCVNARNHTSMRVCV